MPRPKKEEKEKYVHRIVVRLTDDQYKAFLDISKGYRPADYMRLLLFKRMSSALKPRTDREMIKEINKIGVLVNQIAKVVNSGKITSDEMKRFGSEVSNFTKELKNIYIKIR